MNPKQLQLPTGETLALDEKGYLLDRSQWTPAAAECMAAADGLTLTPGHWVVIRIFQDYFEQFGIEPPMRALVQRAREALGEENGDSRALYRLFPAGPGTQACRYAGLPRPLSCI